MSDLTELSAADLGRGIGSGEIDPVALTQAFLDKIEAHPLADRIYARLTPDRLLAWRAARLRSLPDRALVLTAVRSPTALRLRSALAARGARPR